MWTGLGIPSRILRGVIHSSGIMLDKKITPRDLVFLVGGGDPS